MSAFIISFKEVFWIDVRKYSRENFVKMASLCGRLISNVVRRRLIVAPAIQYRQKSTSKYPVSKNIEFFRK